MPAEIYTPLPLYKSGYIVLFAGDTGARNAIVNGLRKGAA